MSQPLAVKKVKLNAAAAKTDICVAYLLLAVFLAVLEKNTNLLPEAWCVFSFFNASAFRVSHPCLFYGKRHH